MRQTAPIPAGGERELPFDIERITALLKLLLTSSTEDIESETVEIKGWCSNETELYDKVGEAAACLANTEGGIILVGVAKNRPGLAKFSPCRYEGLTPHRIVSHIPDLTFPPVECRGQDVTPLLTELAGQHAGDVFALKVIKTRHLSRHVNTKGVAKVRIGRECKPQFAAEDDRSRVTVPEASVGDLDDNSVQWAMTEHQQHFHVSKPADTTEFLAQAGLAQPELESDSPDFRHRVSLAGVLLFGSAAALHSIAPYFETIVITPAGTSTIKSNIVECMRQLCWSPASPLGSILKTVPRDSLRELLVNAYVHRSYRHAAPVIVRLSNEAIEIESPGELPAGLDVRTLINCIPVYRNLCLADAARFIGICDKVGRGIDVVYDAVLRRGLPFPEFESMHSRFTARIAVAGSAEFKEFVRLRSQALSQLEDIIVLRYLWGRDSATTVELAAAMQRPADVADRLISRMVQKEMVMSVAPGTFTLRDSVRRDIATIFQNDQLSMNSMLWGEDE